MNNFYYGFEFAASETTKSQQINDKTGKASIEGEAHVFVSLTEREFWVKAEPIKRKKVTSVALRKLRYGIRRPQYPAYIRNLKKNPTQVAPNIEILVNSELVIKALIRKDIYARIAIRAAVEDAGYDWLETSIYVCDWPKPGQHILKVAGKNNINSGT